MEKKSVLIPVHRHRLEHAIQIRDENAHKNNNEDGRPTLVYIAQPYKHSDDKIDTRFAYGDHIDLTCLKHPEARFSTKNIEYIGARTIFQSQDHPYCDCVYPQWSVLQNNERKKNKDL